MDKPKLIERITEKKEFSRLPEKDVEMIFEKFNKPYLTDLEKIKKTRDLLRKVYSVFASGKLLTLKNRDSEWILKKHISTRERFPFYQEIYNKLLGDYKKSLTVFDLGCGVNGFSYSFFPFSLNYFGVESIGQLVDLQNHYFKSEKIRGLVIHESLFNLEKIKKILSKGKGKKIIFLFKVIDSLEMVERNYSKKFLEEVSSKVNKIVVSFATRSLMKRSKFRVNRNWIYYFIKENFNLEEDFEIGAERYLVFSKR
ncbi:MAG: hypothetical protein KC516_00590 [Nanoarchaeota archaeon]|nr:hypothetical protein [Nanoarchaeota archaeon]